MDGAAGISRRIFGTALTVASYTFAVQQTPAQLKLFLHPVIVSATLIYSGYCALARTTGETARVALMSYFGSGTGPGDILSRLLGTAIISFGVQLFQYKDLLFRNKMRFFLSTFATAITGVFSSAVGVRYLQVTGLTSQASILTRCITTPLAIAAGKLTGADPTLTSAVSLLTGIIGASTGPRLLSRMRVEDPLSQGMALGSSSHSLGASAVVDNPVKFASAIVAMCLTGVWTVALLSVPVVRELVLKLASN
jgi:putative effector of murein hydrolase